ncbi:YgjV family protein [Gilliamella bombicola]|uniref:YgjV family protein n=1 Tax=Gilliamella TaxID=1193503 RepID=UPI000B88B8CE|nr:hypothetical protein [Gilliamella sp. ESL0254]
MNCFVYSNKRCDCLCCYTVFLWVIYSLWIGSLDSLAIEIIFVIINIVAIIKK